MRRRGPDPCVPLILDEGTPDPWSGVSRGTLRRLLWLEGRRCVRLQGS
jgi:hypothetical protein